MTLDLREGLQQLEDIAKLRHKNELLTGMVTNMAAIVHDICSAMPAEIMATENCQRALSLTAKIIAALDSLDKPELIPEP